VAYIEITHLYRVGFFYRYFLNIRGTIGSSGNPEYSEKIAERSCCSFIALASLHFDSRDPAKMYSSEELSDNLDRWSAMDVYHDTDNAYQADFANSVAGRGIAAMNPGRRTFSNAIDIGPATPEDRRCVIFPKNRQGIRRDRSKKEKPTE
jgi:hypothetical protein